MSAHLAVGLTLAVASACALNVGFFAQHQAAHAMPRLSLRRPIWSLWRLFSNARWFTGYAIGMAGWGLYIVALGLAPLSLVQAVAAGGIGLLAILARRTSGASGPRQETPGVVAAIGGLVLVAISLGGHTGSGVPAGRVVWLWLAVSLAAAAIAASPVPRAAWTQVAAARLGAAAGLLYASGDVATKAAFGARHHLAFIPVLLICHSLGFVALQLAFQRGGALSTAGIATLINNSLPIAAGIFVFHDAVPGGALGVGRLAGFGLVAIGAALLARGENEPLAPQPDELARAG